MADQDKDKDKTISVYLQALRDVLPMLRLQGDAQLTKRIGKEKLEEVAVDLEGFIVSGVTGNLSHNERLALASKLLRYLSQYIQDEMGIPVTINTMVTHMSLLAFATEQRFPGYAESKLLKYCVVPLNSKELSKELNSKEINKELLQTRI